MLDGGRESLGQNGRLIGAGHVSSLSFTTVVPCIYFFQSGEERSQDDVGGRILPPPPLFFERWSSEANRSQPLITFERGGWGGGGGGALFSSLPSSLSLPADCHIRFLYSLFPPLLYPGALWHWSGGGGGVRWAGDRDVGATEEGELEVHTPSWSVAVGRCQRRRGRKVLLSPFYLRYNFAHKTGTNSSSHFPFPSLPSSLPPTFSLPWHFPPGEGREGERKRRP